MLSNTTAIAEAWARRDHKFDLMYAKRPLSTGTSERGWRRESSLRQERTWPLLRRTTRRSGWTALRRRARVEKSTKKETKETHSDLCISPIEQHMAILTLQIVH